MRPLKADERDHVEAVGAKKFAEALAKTSMCVRMDSRLTGIDKIREPLAYEAALVATGFPPRGFSLGRKEMPQDLMALCDDLLAKAIAAAQTKTEENK